MSLAFTRLFIYCEKLLLQLCFNGSEELSSWHGIEWLAPISAPNLSLVLETEVQVNKFRA